MADAVVVTTIKETPDELILHLTNISDGTGEAAVVKAAKANYLDRNKAAPAALDIQWVRWAVQGFSSVRLLWDHTTDDLAMVLSSNGFEDFIGMGEGVYPVVTTGLRDPGSAGGLGDLLLTTAGAAAGATYDITIGLYKRPASGG